MSALRRLWIVLLCIVSGRALEAQARYAGEGPGTYVALGGTVSAYQSDYGKQLLGGGTLYLDANLYRRIGMEAEVRTLRLHSDDSLRQSTYLVGPKISSHGGRLRPYAKLLIGRGQFEFPFHFAQGSYFVFAPGAGLDWRLGRSRVILRAIDIEYQYWPQFTFGSLHPFGVSTGLSVRVF